jgi:hypothetical protein
MRALEAGAANGEGDSRCTGDGIPSDSAFVRVDRADEVYLSIEVTATAPNDPLPMLRAMYDDWRATHPCPVMTADAADVPDPDMAGGCCSTGSGGAPGAIAIAAIVAVVLGRGTRNRWHRSSSG